MGEEHPLGVMADPRELLRALKALGAIDRMPAPDEATEMELRTGGRELWRLECAHHLAGVLEAQVLMAGGAAADAGYQTTPVLQAGWGFFDGASTAEDAARVGLLEAMARRLVDLLMLMVARQRRGDGDELLSPLVMPALPIASALAGVLDAAALESGEHADPRKGLGQVVEQLRSMADLLDTMIPGEYRVT
jgi:hypothetical protein